MDRKTQSIDEQNDYAQIQNSFLGSDKCLKVGMAEKDDDEDQGWVPNGLAGVAHFFTFCKTTLDKFILVFNLLKLAVVEGKTVIMVSDVTQAYRLKYFLAKFSLRSFVLGTDMRKSQISSILHFFNTGSFDILVMLHSGYAKRPMIKDVTNIINFDMPSHYNLYKQGSMTITEKHGCVLSMPMPGNEIDVARLGLLQHKFKKIFGRDDMMLYLPLIWTELAKSKFRVESVFYNLSDRAVKYQTGIELKKGLVNN